VSAAELVLQLHRWKGTGRIWQLLAAADYDRWSLERSLARALILGWVVVDVDPIDDPDEDLIVITHRALTEGGRA
jgi:hypothetical protein